MADEVESQNAEAIELSEAEPAKTPRLRQWPLERPHLVQVGSIAGLLVVIALAVWAIQSGVIRQPNASVPEPLLEVEAAAQFTQVPMLSIGLDDLPPFEEDGLASQGIVRSEDLHTIIPSRPRLGVLKYQVQQGDTLFGIADNFGLKPESILWGNWLELNGDPHLLKPGQELSILPVDGALHIWTAGEGLNGVAAFYGVTAEDIIDWPGNDLDPQVDTANPGIEDGSALIIPGGRRELPSWQRIYPTRSNPAVAKILGPGACGAVSSGPVGDGVFGWPTPSTGVSGYGYLPGVHEAIDIGGSTGNAIYAADDGVVVYSGWNNWGYGYVIVIDHGTGWQTLYAHLSRIDVGCGQGVSQSQVIGGMGCTGNCSGSHLHFEMRSESFGRVNPLLFLP